MWQQWIPSARKCTWNCISHTQLGNAQSPCKQGKPRCRLLRCRGFWWTVLSPKNANIWEIKHFPWKGCAGQIFQFELYFKVGNCPFIISETKNSFHLKLLLISQFKLMRFFFLTWLNTKHFKVIKMNQCWLPPYSFYSHFHRKNAYHHLYLHVRKNI